MIRQRLTPRFDVAEFIATETSDAARLGDALIFVQRWESTNFDPLAFGRSRVFLAQLTHTLQKAGYRAEPLDPLSPTINLPRLAAQGGLGNLSPYGLLVHPVFGPRLIITGLKTDYPLDLQPRYNAPACDDCLACVLLCPQQPQVTHIVDLGKCQTCARCLAVCPTGKGRRARQLLSGA